ncbi:beta-N-acetylglucosaminidase [Corynebacterium sp. L4756]|uniref:beta-N-acetylglucosaminidase n=1 Tax=unclassified Corynebacterium TaxID=2624378 RepID=UPI00374DA9E8
MPTSRPSRILQLTGAAFLATTLVACGTTEETAPSPAPETSAVETEEPSETTTEEPSESSTSSETEESTTEIEESESAEASESEAAEPTESTSASAGEFTDDVEAAYEIFGSIAPRSLFEEFDSCDPVGNNDNYNCSGPEVGQLQFSKSSSRASQTTQVLTELRSSTVLEDSGDRVVGWSTLGSTAVLTVVDNNEGLVVQQMLSTDQEDPEDRLIELGLYNPDN